jgi:site-specific DNA-methyltransferase (adenine-specific)
MKYNITHGSILDWAASYSGPKFHALLCDPPYHLTEITKRFGKADSAPAQYGSDGAFQRTSKGFMGKTWDGGRIAFEPETWVALAEHLHPGAYGMAFASTRGYHRMACAIEDAGLIIHTMLGWSFGSGFPKATRVDTQIDKRAGAERATIG